jgi:ubiquinol oxidase
MTTMQLEPTRGTESATTDAPVSGIGVVPAPHAALGSLTPSERRRAQQRTLDTPRRRYSLAARALFRSLDVVYGRERTLVKFRMLELIARMPYQAWERVGYIAMTHRAEHIDLVRRIAERVDECRSQQDNEQWHLLLLEELEAAGLDHADVGHLRSRVIPQVVAFTYYQVSWLLYVGNPAWSYRLNADFEDHAEHEYMTLAAEHPEWESAPWASELCGDYGSFESVADLLRQIGVDEREHKLESEHNIIQARFR